MENDDFLSNFAVDRVYNNYEYDANGNMTKTTKYSLPLMQPSFPAILSSRNLYWNDSDQLQAMTDYSNSAHYFYNYAGDRTWKVVGAKTTTTLSGIQRTYNVFNQSTYYLFPQVTITNSAYTKHIFAGTERICSKIGTGKSVDMLQLLLPPTAQITAKRSQQTNLMKRTFSNLCIPNLNPPPIFLCAIVNGGNILSTNLLSSSAAKITSTATEYEDLQYFYLSDHLGSSSWITDKDGNALQHLSYLPFGEIFVNQKVSGSTYDSEFKFSGKPLDLETGYSYFGARYLDSKLGLWLSPDPLAHMRPWITPYNYAQNNPATRSDPSGLLDGDFHNEKGKYLGTDGINDNKIHIISDKASIKTIKANNKSGGKTQTSDVKVGFSTNKKTLKEAVNVYNRTVANGGYCEEGSVVSPDGSKILNAERGNDVRDRKASVRLPYMQGDDNTSIHSHPLEEYMRDGIVNYSSPFYPSRTGEYNDEKSFKSYNLNIIVGNSHQYDDDSKNANAVFYDRNTNQIGKMTIRNLTRMLK